MSAHNTYSTREAPEAGFTLIELMIVVTIVAILGAVSIPKYISYVRSSQAAEVGNTAGLMVSAMQAYEDAQSLAPAAMVTTFNNSVLVPSGSTVQNGATNLSALLPNLNLPSNAMFTYAVSAAVATAGDMKGDVVFCISATGNPNAGVPTATVLYSSSPASAAAKGWAGRVFNQLYVTGVTAAPASGNTTAGGYCSTTGAAQATQS